jgi:gamma-glutamylcyclotransferase (GGCT)/AIG2-like uncharacterized protein YtfP
LLPRLAPPSIAPVMARLRRVGRGFARGHLYDLGRFPAAILRQTGPKVWGEVFELPAGSAEILLELDRYEGFDAAYAHRSSFLRQQCRIVLEHGKALTAWAYTYNRAPGAAPRISTGDFTRPPAPPPALTAPSQTGSRP